MLGDEASLQRIEEQLQAGDNVIFLANHQTEADPQLIGLMLRDKYPLLADRLIFVAGARVTTDPMAAPFSLGQNLLCIYSKRYMDGVSPEERELKQAHNKKTMDKMADLLADGGRAIYVAPSGGRDRINQVPSPHP